MSRRPQDTRASQVRLARRRGVPKGRMWNEMPINTAPIRVGMAGEEAPLAPPEKVTYGPWITGEVLTGQLVQPKVYVSGDPQSANSYRALGDGRVNERSYASGAGYGDTGGTNNNQTLQYARSEIANTPEGYSIPPGRTWIVEACTHFPVRDGLQIFPPSFAGQPTAVGWDLGPVRYYDQARCQITYPTVFDTYVAWRDGTGKPDYYKYLVEAVSSPILPGTGYMDAWYRIVFRTGTSTASPMTNTVVVGSGSSYTVRDNSAGTYPTVYKDRVFLTGAFTPITGANLTAIEPSTGSQTAAYTGQSFPGLALPSVVDLPGWGPCRIPAYRHVPVPWPSTPTLGPDWDWVVQACLDFKCFGQANRPPYRFIYAA